LFKRTSRLYIKHLDREKFIYKSNYKKEYIKEEESKEELNKKTM
jgi:hypothetical protein